MFAQRRTFEDFRPARFDVRISDRDRRAQRLEPGAILRHALFDEPDALAQNLASILKPAGVDKFLNQSGLVIGQDDVARWHVNICSKKSLA